MNNVIVNKWNGNVDKSCMAYVHLSLLCHTALVKKHAVRTVTRNKPMLFFLYELTVFRGMTLNFNNRYNICIVKNYVYSIKVLFYLYKGNDL